MATFVRRKLPEQNVDVIYQQKHNPAGNAVS